MNRCRVCSNHFFKEPLLLYKNMPRAAQFLPEVKSLAQDHGITLTVCQCSACGLVQLSNSPVPYYKKVMRASGISPEMRNFRLRQFADFLQKYSLKKKKIIEIGCGRGEYLSLMRQCGAETYGLEESYEAVEYCKKNSLKVSKGFIQNDADRIGSDPFDAFYILNFLEHLPDPNSTLRGIYYNLTDEAFGLVEVPNFEMILRKNLFSEFIADHLLYFTKETLKTTLMINGFDVIESKAVWHDYIISAVVRKSENLYRPVNRDWYIGKKLDMSHFYQHQTKIKKDIEKYLARFKNKKVAIWGAGHQALTIISLAKLAGKIKYVVDSAPFKQGKYTPATHIPIVSPESLDSNPVDAIIIMAASYSDEVFRIISQKYGKKYNIAVLRGFGLETV